DPAMDLYVWYDGTGAIQQFQLCYDKGPEEKALTWRRDGGLEHHRVDDGEGGVLRMKSSAMLTEDAGPAATAVQAAFAEAGRKLEHDLYEFIMNILTGSQR